MAPATKFSARITWAHTAECCLEGWIVGVSSMLKRLSRTFLDLVAEFAELAVYHVFQSLHPPDCGLNEHV